MSFWSCGEFYRIALAWICDPIYRVGLNTFILYSHLEGQHYCTSTYGSVLACVRSSRALFAVAFGAVGAVRSSRGCRGCPELAGLSGLSGAFGAVRAVRSSLGLLWAVTSGRLSGRLSGRSGGRLSDERPGPGCWSFVAV